MAQTELSPPVRGNAIGWYTFCSLLLVLFVFIMTTAVPNPRGWGFVANCGPWQIELRDLSGTRIGVFLVYSMFVSLLQWACSIFFVRCSMRAVVIQGQSWELLQPNDESILPPDLFWANFTFPATISFFPQIFGYLAVLGYVAGNPWMFGYSALMISWYIFSVIHEGPEKTFAVIAEAMKQHK